MRGSYSCIRCVTNWGAILSVEHISGNLVCVSDPTCIDAGMWIGDDEIQTIWKISLYSDFSHPQYPNKEWAKINGIF